MRVLAATLVNAETGPKSTTMSFVLPTELSDVNPYAFDVPVPRYVPRWNISACTGELAVLCGPVLGAGLANDPVQSIDLILRSEYELIERFTKILELVRQKDTRRFAVEGIDAMLSRRTPPRS